MSWEAIVVHIVVTSIFIAGFTKTPDVAKGKRKSQS